MPQAGVYFVYPRLSQDLLADLLRWLVSQPPIMVICVPVLSSFYILSPCFPWLCLAFESYSALQIVRIAAASRLWNAVGICQVITRRYQETEAARVS